MKKSKQRMKSETGSVEESEDFEKLKEDATERLQLRFPFDKDGVKKIQLKMNGFIIRTPLYL